MAGARLARRAGRTRADREAGEIERHQLGGGGHAGQAEVKDVRQARRGGALDDAACRDEPCFERLAAGGDGGPVGNGCSKRCGPTGEGGEGRCAGAMAALLRAGLGSEGCVRGGDERARTHRAAHLVGGQGEIVASGDGQLSGGLHAIDEQAAAMGGDEGGDGGDGLDDAGLVVAVLDGDKGRAGAQGGYKSGFKGGEIEQAGGEHRDALDVRPATQDCAMFGGAGENAGMGGHGALESLGAAAGEHHLLGQHARQPGDGVADSFQHGARGPAFGVERGRVAVERGGFRHGGTRRLPSRGGGGMVEINAAFRCDSAHGAFIDGVYRPHSLCDGSNMPEVIFPGPEGRLEGRYQPAIRPRAPVAILLQPHPAQGTMNHPIVMAMYNSFVKRGFAVLRFNFRGVGRSQGVFDNGIGELSDAASALDWMQQFNPEAHTTWVGGFSFGAWIGMQLLMRRPEIKGFISIAPPANMYDFSFLAPCPSSGIIVDGEADEVVSGAAVQKLVDKLKTQKHITIEHQTIPGANHFFQNEMPLLMGAVDGYLDMRLANGGR